MAKSVSRKVGQAGLIALSVSMAPQAFAGPVEDHRVLGWTLATQQCSQCHAIGKGDGAGEFAGPSFTAVAAMPSTTGMALNVFLQSHHPSMPSVRLDRDEMDAVIDYILSLKAAEPTGR